MVGPVRSVLTRPQVSARQGKSSGTWLLLASVAAFAVALGAHARYTVTHSTSFTMDPVDLAVYRSGGLIVRHLEPLYNPHLASPLYDWTGYGGLHLQFTDTPWRPALVPRIPLARPGAHGRQRVHPRQAGCLRGAARDLAAAARGQEEGAPR